MNKKNVLSIIFWCMICLFISLPSVYAETFEEYKERTKKEQEAKKNESNNKKNNDDSGGNFIGSCLGAMCQVFLAASFSDSEDEYNNDEYTEGEYNEGGSSEEDSCIMPDSGVLAEIGVQGSYLFGDGYTAWGVSGLADVTFFVFHANIRYLRLMNTSGFELNSFTGNLGLSLVMDVFMVNLYGGVLVQDYYTGFSFGGSLKVKFAPNFIYTFYSLISFDDYATYIILTSSFNFKIEIFSFGVGFDFNYWDGLLTYGPMIKAALWF